MKSKRHNDPLMTESFAYLYSPTHDWEKTQTSIKRGDDDYEIVRRLIPSKQKDVSEYKYFIIDKSKFLGDGATGKVYLAYLIDPKTFKADLKRPLAAKIFSDKKTFNEKEAKILGRYRRTELPIVQENRIILITEFLKGKALVDDYNIPHADLKKLNFNQRVNLVVQILLDLNLLHHNTPTTGSAVMHSDMKGSNVLLHVDPKTLQTEAAVCDFGYSEDTEDDPFLLIKSIIQGTPGYFPPELLLQEMRGIKSDIYSLVPIIIYIFGGTNPFPNLLKSEQDPKRILAHEIDNIKNRYNYENIFTGYPIPNHAKKILFPLLDFLVRMQNDTYKDRPDSDEVLRFFTTLNNYCKACEKNSDADSIAILHAKLILLSSGTWHHTVGSKEMECYKERRQKTPDGKTLVTWELTHKNVQTSFEQYDFDEYPVISKAIVALQQKDTDHKKVFDPEIARALYSKQDVRRATIIVAFDEIGSLNATSLKRITTGYTSKQLNAIMNLYQHNLLTQASLQLVDSESFALKVNQLSKESWKQLTQLINIGKSYGFIIDLNALKDIISDRGEISVSEVLKATLQAYKIDRKNDKRGNYFHFWSRHLGGFSGETKCKAVDEKLASLDDPSTAISLKSQKALNDGRLKKLLRAFQPYINAEQVIQPIASKH